MSKEKVVKEEMTVAGPQMTADLFKSKDPKLRPVIGKCILALGGLLVNFLLTRGGVAVYFDRDGTVSMASLEEVALDGLEEGEAILRLSQAGFSDEKIAHYLKGRDARVPVR